MRTSKHVCKWIVERKLKTFRFLRAVDGLCKSINVTTSKTGGKDFDEWKIITKTRL